MGCRQVSFLVFLEAAQEVQEDYWRDRVSGGDQGEEASQDQELRYLAEVRLQVWTSLSPPPSPSATGTWELGTEPEPTPSRLLGVRLLKLASAAVPWSHRCTTPRSSSLRLAGSRNREEDSPRQTGQALTSSKIWSFGVILDCHLVKYIHW